MSSAWVKKTDIFITDPITNKKLQTPTYMRDLKKIKELNLSY